MITCRHGISHVAAFAARADRVNRPAITSTLNPTSTAANLGRRPLFLGRSQLIHLYRIPLDVTQLTQCFSKSQRKFVRTGKTDHQDTNGWTHRWASSTAQLGPKRS